MRSSRRGCHGGLGGARNEAETLPSQIRPSYFTRARFLPLVAASRPPLLIPHLTPVRHNLEPRHWRSHSLMPTIVTKLSSTDPFSNPRNPSHQTSIPFAHSNLTRSLRSLPTGWPHPSLGRYAVDNQRALVSQPWTSTFLHPNQQGTWDFRCGWGGLAVSMHRHVLPHLRRAPVTIYLCQVRHCMCIKFLNIVLCFLVAGYPRSAGMPPFFLVSGELRITVASMPLPVPGVIPLLFNRWIASLLEITTV